MENLKTEDLLKRQLDELLTTLNFMPESQQAGNAAYYLKRIADYVSHLGVDEPMVASLWFTEDLEEVSESTIEREQARHIFAVIDRHHNAEVGINWDVLEYAIDNN